MTVNDRNQIFFPEKKKKETGVRRKSLQWLVDMH